MDGFTALIQKSDDALLYLFNRRLRCIVLNIIMSMITQLGSTLFTILVPIILLVLGDQRIKEIGYHMGITLILSQFFVHSIKRIVNRPRPYRVLDQVIACNPPGCKYSFPSGHTCAAFSMVLALGMAFPTIQLFLLLLGSLVGISRIYLGFHYPTDVLFGAFLAYSSFYLVSISNLTYFI